MDLFNIIGHYFWLIGLGTCAFQYVRSVNRQMAASIDPVTQREIDFYRNVAFAAQAAPWLIMGAGIMTGSVPDIWGFFRLRDGNPFVIAFVGLTILLAFGLAAWVFSGGAKKVVDLHLFELLNSHYKDVTERGVKLMSAGGVLGALAWVYGCLVMNVPSPGNGSAPLASAASDSGQAVSADGYRIVFDVAHAGWGYWSFPAFGLIFVVVGSFMVYFRHDLPMKGPAFMRRAFPFIWLGFAIFWTVTSFSGTYFSYHRLTTALAEGRAQVVDGMVSNFVPMPAAGHAKEKFCVQQACFSYSDFVISGGFNNTASHGGPIAAGRHVRVTYVGDVIVRLEVAQDGSSR